MRILYCKVGQQPEEKEISGSLKSMQELVGGYIDVVFIAPDAAVVCNEEGRLNGSTANRFLINNLGEISGILYGDFFIVGTKVDFETLTDEQVKTYKALYSLPSWAVFSETT